jgi:glutamate-1-semialdehyde 2,1-aminomutase
VYQAGTLSGNPLAMRAGLTTLEALSEPGFHDKLTRKTIAVREGIKQAADEAGIPLTVQGVGGMFGLFFTEEENVTRFNQVMTCDKERFGQFFKGMLKEGVYLAPSPFEAGFTSAALSEQDIQETIGAAERVMKTL